MEPRPKPSHRRRSNHGQHQPRRPRREPDPRPRAPAHAVRHRRLQAQDRRQLRQKDSSTGEWGEKPNYFDVTVWGNQGESCAQYLSKGRPVGVDGRLDWREWEAQDGTKRQAVEIIADSVQFLGGRGDGEGGQREFVPAGVAETAPTSARPAPTTTSPSRSHCMPKARREQRSSRRGPPTGPIKRRSCQFCRDKVEEVDYKNTNVLRRHVSEKGRSARAASPAPAGATSARSRWP